MRVCTRLFTMQGRASSEKRSREACRPEASLRASPTFLQQLQAVMKVYLSA